MKKNCENKKSCNLNINLRQGLNKKEQKNITLSNENLQDIDIYLKYRCYNPSVNLGIANKTIHRNTFDYIDAAFNVLSILIMWISLI